MNDRRLTLRKSEGMPDWWVIEWEEHDGRMWLERTGVGVMSLRSSARVSDADVEGTREEMLAIAVAIEASSHAFFTRCGVSTAQDGSFRLSSPRNSQVPATISATQAHQLATAIRQALEHP